MAYEIEKLIDRRADAFNQAEKLLREHTDADGKIPIEISEKVDQLIDEAEKLTGKIVQDRFSKTKDELSKPVDKPILEQPCTDFFGENGGLKMQPQNFSATASNEYRRAFIEGIRNNFRITDDILTVGTSSQGGYLCPEEMDSQIVAALEEQNICRQICRVIQTAGTHKIPIVAEKPTAAWTAETAPVNFSNESFEEVELQAHKLTCGLKLSRELLEDAAFDIQAHIIDQCSAAIARSEEESFITGDGVGKPTGILTSIATITGAIIETTGTTITADDLVSLEYALPRPYRQNAVWVMSDDTLAIIRRLKDSTQNFIFQPQMTENEPARIFGRPIYTSGFMPSPTAGETVILFGDFKSGYVIGDRAQRSVQALHELFAANDISAFLLRERVDGKLVDKNAIKALRLK